MILLADPSGNQYKPFSCERFSPQTSQMSLSNPRYEAAFFGLLHPAFRSPKDNSTGRTGSNQTASTSNNPMNTSISTGAQSRKPESYPWKRCLGRIRGLNVYVILAFACVLAPEYSSGQASSDPCPINTVEPPPGLVGWWPLGEKSGTKVTDGSGHDNHGTSKPGAIGSTAPLGPVSAPGFVGSGMRFFAGSYVRIANSNNLDSLVAFNEDFTIDAWIKAGNGPIVGNFNPAKKLGYALYITANQLTFDMGRGNLLPILSVKRPIVPNAWNFVAVVVKRTSSTPKGNRVTLYSGTTALPAGTSTSIPLDAKSHSGLPVDIGKCTGSQLNCTTVIDELEMFNRSLLLADLQKIFNAKHNGKCIRPASKAN